MTLNGDLLLLLPDDFNKKLRLIISRKRDGFIKFDELWCGERYWAEPLADHFRLLADGILSILTVHENNDGTRDVVVLDFDLL